MFGKNLVKTGAQAVSTGLGSYLAVVLFSPDARDARVNLFGSQMNLAMASAVAVASAVFFDELVYKNFVRGYLARFPQLLRILDTADYVGRGVMLGLMPSFLVYMGNNNMPLSGAFLFGLTMFVGGETGSHLSEKVFEPAVGLLI